MEWRLELEPEEVEARLRWARREGHPRYVWPEVEPGDWRSGVRELERVAKAVLGGETAALMERGEPDARALGVAGYTSGLGPLVGHWIERGEVRASPRLSWLFGLHLAEGRRRATRQRAELERSTRALAEAGVASLVVKSAHTGRMYFPEPGTRPGVDVDLVVAPDAFARAEEALEGAGYVLAARQWRPAKSDWAPAGLERLPRSLELLHSASQYAIDLQSSLDRNFFGVRRVRISDVRRAPARPAPELGSCARVLEQPCLLAYQALHASEGLENLTLIRLVELVLIIRRDTGSGALDWDELVRLLEEIDGSRFAYPALALAERLAPGTMDPGVLRALARAAPERMRRVVHALTPGGAQRLEILALRDRFIWCGTPSEYLRRLGHMVLPAPAGRSVRRLASQYAERFYRLARRRVRAARSELIGGRDGAREG